MTNEDLHALIDSNADAAVLEIYKREREIIHAAIFRSVSTVLIWKEKESKQAKESGKGRKEPS